MILGRKSTLFLAYAYQLDELGEAKLIEQSNLPKGIWKRRRIEGAALLPHLDDYVRKGELLRAYEVGGDLRAAFGPRDRWTLTDGDKSVDISITEPPRLYTFDTRYVFMVVGVTPIPPPKSEDPPATPAPSTLEEAGASQHPKKNDPVAAAAAAAGHIVRPRKPRGKQEEPELTLSLLEDVAYLVVRAGVSKVKDPPIQMQRWLEANHLKSSEPLSLRRWLAQLVPGLRHAAPRGTPRTTAPGLFSVILAPAKLADDDLHRLRLVHRADQSVEPGASVLDDEHGAWRCSSQELCMFSSFGFSWVVEGFDQSKFLSDTPHMIRDRYIYKWLIVEHQRLCLLALATECADMSRGLDGSNFAEMRMQLLTFIAKYNFRHISNEERHDRFYRRAQESLAIDDLLEEVREEVVEIDTQLAARRAETLNHVLAFLTLVLTPVGLIVGVFQTDTIPEKFQFRLMISLSAWIKLFTHPPFIVVLAAAAIGATVYVRLFGASVVIQLLRTLLLKRKYKEEEPGAEPRAGAEPESASASAAKGTGGGDENRKSLEPKSSADPKSSAGDPKSKDPKSGGGGDRKSGGGSGSGGDPKSSERKSQEPVSAAKQDNKSKSAPPPKVVSNPNETKSAPPPKVQEAKVSETNE